MGLIGILLGLALLMWLAYRGWSVLLVSPLAALIAAVFSGEPLQYEQDYNRSDDRQDQAGGMKR